MARPGTRILDSVLAYRVLATVASFALLLAVWVVGHRFTPYLPPIADVVDQVRVLLAEPGELAAIVATTLRRLVIGVAIAYVAAVLTALLMRRSALWEGFLAPYVLVATATPSLVAALLSVMIFGFSETGVYVAMAVVVYPYILLSLSEGFGSLDEKLSEMAFAYHLTPRQYYQHVAFPELMPHLFAALRSGHALGWKIVILIEVFGSGSGIGYQYKRAYDLFDLELLVSWIIFFLAVVWFVEYGILKPISLRLFRWRS